MRGVLLVTSLVVLANAKWVPPEDPNMPIEEKYKKKVPANVRKLVNSVMDRFNPTIEVKELFWESAIKCSGDYRRMRDDKELGHWLYGPNFTTKLSDKQEKKDLLKYVLACSAWRVFIDHPKRADDLFLHLDRAGRRLKVAYRNCFTDIYYGMFGGMMPLGNAILGEKCHNVKWERRGNHLE